MLGIQRWVRCSLGPGAQNGPLGIALQTVSQAAELGVRGTRTGEGAKQAVEAGSLTKGFVRSEKAGLVLQMGTQG